MSTFMLARYLKIYKWADLFSKIIENPNVTEKDLCYEEDKSGNNPIMIAAKLRNKDLVKNELGIVDHLFYKSCIFLPYLRKSLAKKNGH